MVYEIEATMDCNNILKLGYGVKLGERGIHINQLGSFIYIGSKLKKITNDFLSGLREKNLELRMVSSDFSDTRISRRNKFPFCKTIARFTDDNYVEGKIEIRITGIHPDKTIMPLLDFELDGTAKCEKELFGKYTGLPTWRYVEKIVKTIEKQR